MRSSFFLLPICLFAGCAKSPSGAPTTPQANNRLAVTLRLKEPVNPQYLYSFAFDDDDEPTDGPVALVGSNTAPNGAVGGSFTVLVQYRSGRFTAFRRGGSSGSETLQVAPNAFVVAPTVSVDRLSFTLNLDATLPDGSRLFRSPQTAGIPDSLDFNFITTDRPRIDPNDLRPSTFDALGRLTGGRFFELDIRTPRNETNASLRINEPINDVVNLDTTGRVDSDQLDIADFAIRIERSR